MEVIMSKFLSIDRKRILLSALFGSLLIIISYFLFLINYFLTEIISFVVVLITYIGFQFGMFFDRDLVDKDDRVFNADGLDVTTKLPYNLGFQFTAFIILIIMFNNYRSSLFYDLKQKYDDYRFILQPINEILVFLGPYLFIHIYFFYKDLPITTILRYTQAGSIKKATHGDSYKANDRSSSQDYYYNSSNSSYGGNIFHSSKRDR